MVLNVLIVIGIVIAMPFIIALFVNKDYVIEREIVINRPKEEVFDYIKLSKNQDYYSKWVMTDPLMTKNFNGVDGTVGFVYAWNGNKKAGEGEQEIIKLLDGVHVTNEVRFTRPFKNIAYTNMRTETTSDNNTKVKWNMEGKNAYPLNFTNLFIGRMLRNDLAESLSNLKTILERK